MGALFVCRLASSCPGGSEVEERCDAGALVALVLNLVVAAIVTLVLGRSGRADERDETRPQEYDELGETREPAPTVGAGVA
jgi:hypothetical protein